MADSTDNRAQFLYRIVPVRADMLVTGPTEHEMQVMGTQVAVWADGFRLGA